MSMIVARMQKMKTGNLIGIGNHNQRKTQNHSNKEIDPSLSKLNYDLVNQTEYYKRDIEKFINENKATERAVRKDAVLVNEWVITSDKKFFERLSDEETKRFFISAKDYFAENFGSENIRYATVHLDETTPHMHMGIVPFDKDKKLSAKRIFNREALFTIQEDLPKHLQEKGFEIERGLEGSERKNLTVPEFKEMKREQEEIGKEIHIRKNELLAYNKEINIDKGLDVTAYKEMTDLQVPTGEKNIFGKEKMRTESEWTKRVIVSVEDYNEMRRAIKNGIKVEFRLNSLLDTDVLKENRALKTELKDLKNETNEIVVKYNSLVKKYNSVIEEKSLYKARISDLTNEIGLIYKSTKYFLKEHTSDTNAFKIALSELIDNVSNNSKDNNLDSNFKREFDKDRNKERSQTITR